MTTFISNCCSECFLSSSAALLFHSINFHSYSLVKLLDMTRECVFKHVRFYSSQCIGSSTMCLLVLEPLLLFLSVSCYLYLSMIGMRVNTNWRCSL